MIFKKIKINSLKRKIGRNPYLGFKDSDSIYVYRQGKYIVEYTILEENTKDKKPQVKIISIKHRLIESEIERRKTKEILLNFFRYQNWVYLLKPQIVLAFLIGLSILYFGVIEPYQNKVDRFRWIVAKVIGVEPNQIEYSAGLFRVFGRRQIAYKEDTEYVSFAFNPLSIFSSKNMGYVTRWSKDTGYITHPISYDDAGDVWIKYKDSWEHGMVSNNQIKWDTPQGTTIRKISGHEISAKDQDLRILDQK